jgi:adenylyltransferase/sulfurtransferase
MTSERFSRSDLVPGYSRGDFSKKTVAIIGLGGLGGPIGQYLMGLGISCIKGFDMDVIEESNLNRQLLYTNDDVGTPKAVAFEKRLEERNSVTIVEGYEEEITIDNMDGYLNDVDVIFSCVDNVQTRLELNDFCLEHNVPLIHGGTGGKGMEGEICTIVPGKTPCLRCFIPPRNDREQCSLEKNPSIVATLVLVSSLMINEFQNLIMGKPIIPPVLQFASSRMYAPGVTIDENGKEIFDNGEKFPEPFYYTKIKRKIDCKCN